MTSSGEGEGREEQTSPRKKLFPTSPRAPLLVHAHLVFEVASPIFVTRIPRVSPRRPLSALTEDRRKTTRYPTARRRQRHLVTLVPPTLPKKKGSFPYQLPFEDKDVHDDVWKVGRISLPSPAVPHDVLPSPTS